MSDKTTQINSTDRLVRIAAELRSRGVIDDIIGARLHICCNSKHQWTWALVLPGNISFSAETLADLCDSVEREYGVQP